MKVRFEEKKLELWLQKGDERNVCWCCWYCCYAGSQQMKRAFGNCEEAWTVPERRKEQVRGEAVKGEEVSIFIKMDESSLIVFINCLFIVVDISEMNGSFLF